jgi:type I restriction enzyme R subunit
MTFQIIYRLWKSGLKKKILFLADRNVLIDQTISGDDGEEAYLQFQPNFFDLIVIDECHRGSAKEESAWRKILDYFSSATHVGCTATPIETQEASSTSYFGEAIYEYSLKQGIEDGFLAPW